MQVLGQPGCWAASSASHARTERNDSAFPRAWPPSEMAGLLTLAVRQGVR